MKKLIQKYFRIKGFTLPSLMHIVLIAHWRTVIFNFRFENTTANSKV